MTLSLGFLNLLEQLIELRETFYLLDYWFVIKGYKSGTARWKSCVGQAMGRGSPMLSESVTLSQCPRIHQREALLTHPLRFSWRLPKKA